MPARAGATRVRTGRGPLRAAAGALALGMLPALSGCGGGSTPAPAPGATGVACTTALKALPDYVLGKRRTSGDTAGTAEWGKPPIRLECGLPEQPPTTLPCLSIDGIDWVIDDGGDPLVFTAFGRSPTVQVRVPLSYGRENASAALVDLAPVATGLPRTSRACVGG
jgi:hypothetical protein